MTASRPSRRSRSLSCLSIIERSKASCGTIVASERPWDISRPSSAAYSSSSTETASARFSGVTLPGPSPAAGALDEPRVGGLEGRVDEVAHLHEPEAGIDVSEAEALEGEPLVGAFEVALDLRGREGHGVAHDLAAIDPRDHDEVPQPWVEVARRPRPVGREEPAAVCPTRRGSRRGDARSGPRRGWRRGPPRSGRRARRA
jgi:hypothetical protein